MVGIDGGGSVAAVLVVVVVLEFLLLLRRVPRPCFYCICFGLYGNETR